MNARLPSARRMVRALAASALLSVLAAATLAAATPKPIKGKVVAPKPGRRGAPAEAKVSGFAGHWEGAIVVFGSPIGIRVDARGAADSLRATIDIPAQGVAQLPLHDVRQRGDSIGFILRAPGTEATFAGVQRGDSVAGAFRQAGVNASFHLERGDAIVRAPEPPVPYERKDVQYPAGNVTLAGTLTRPKGSGRFPAVLLVSGSGPQNRDEEIFGFKPFAILADHLTRHGIAVLRVDDRGIGGSTGDFRAASSLDFADDARAGLRFLRAQAHVDPRRVGLLGHSEGGLIGPLIAAGGRGDSVAFLVLLAPPGLRGDTLLRIQADRIQTAGGMDDTLRALNARAQALLIHGAETGQGIEEARVATRVVLQRAYARGGVTVDDSTLNAAVEGQVRMMTGPWMRYYLTVDPADALAKVRCPVLVVFGAQDLQVPPDVNVPPIEAALARSGNRDVSVRVLPRANHLFQETDSGNPALYATLPKVFVPGLLDTLTGWIGAHTRARR